VTCVDEWTRHGVRGPVKSDPEDAGSVCWEHFTTGPNAGQSNRLAGRTQGTGACLAFARFPRLCFSRAELRHLEDYRLDHVPDTSFLCVLNGTWYNPLYRAKASTD
jgi:hypothetical protein